MPLPQCLDRVRSVRLSYQPTRLLMAYSTQSTEKSIQSNWTASIKIASQIMIGIGPQKMFSEPKALVTLLLLHLIVTPCFLENGHILLAQRVRVVLFTDFHFSNTRPFFHRDVCQQGFANLALFSYAISHGIAILRRTFHRVRTNSMALDTSCSDIRTTQN